MWTIYRKNILWIQVRFKPFKICSLLVVNIIYLTTINEHSTRCLCRVLNDRPDVWLSMRKCMMKIWNTAILYFLDSQRSDEYKVDLTMICSFVSVITFRGKYWKYIEFLLQHIFWWKSVYNISTLGWLR